MLLAYLKRQYKLLLLLAGAVCVFAAVFALYDLPLEAVAYAGVLCLVLGLVLFAVGYSRFLRRHRELQQLLRQAREKALPLPPTWGLLEEDYQALLRAVCQDRARLAAPSASTETVSRWSSPTTASASGRRIRPGCLKRVLQGTMAGRTRSPRGSDCTSAGRSWIG